MPILNALSCWYGYVAEAYCQKDLPAPQSLLSIKTVWVRDERKRWSSVILDPTKSFVGVSVSPTRGIDLL